MSEPRFVYHANAAGVGGRFTRIDAPTRPLHRHPPQVDNVDYIVPMQGASCLPVFGGLSESKIGPYQFHVATPSPITLMSVGSVYTRALSQHPAERPFRAEVEARVSDLQFIERLTVRHAVARMTAIHDGAAAEVPKLRPECCELEGLLLDGYPVFVELNTTPFTSHATYDEVCGDLKALMTEFPQHLQVDPQRADLIVEGVKAGNDRNDDRVIVGTIVSKIEFRGNPPPGMRRGSVPNSIKWEGVGEIFLGELLMSRTERRLTMVRVKFGSEIAGSGGGPEVQGNSGPVQGK